mmetsp:Transcript_17398/g.29848  ORF Transcript_17398/g.29848 Transcript_17398/m.29848 type:complete len:218 (+) Transcript_17398:1060-1713(+)
MAKFCTDSCRSGAPSPPLIAAIRRAEMMKRPVKAPIPRLLKSTRRGRRKGAFASARMSILAFRDNPPLTSISASTHSRRSLNSRRSLSSRATESLSWYLLMAVTTHSAARSHCFCFTNAHPILYMAERASSSEGLIVIAKAYSRMASCMASWVLPPSVSVCILMAASTASRALLGTYFEPVSMFVLVACVLTRRFAHLHDAAAEGRMARKARTMPGP